MKGRIPLIAGVLGCVTLAIGISQPAAQTGAPSEQDIGQALRPVPHGLGEHQGLPTLGSTPRRTPQSPNLHGASLPSSSGRPTARTRKNRPSIAFNTIQFAFDSAQLTPGSTETLRNLGNALNHELADQKAFLIEGHTDASGGLQYNMLLSRRRAEAVKDYLVRTDGVSPSRLQTVGKGPTDPINPANPYAAENRRVVVINTGG